jgi:hypothetical protein
MNWLSAPRFGGEARDGKILHSFRLLSAGPDVLNHICNADQFLVSGGSIVPVICGFVNGDHIYVDAGLGQSNPIILTVITSGVPFPRNWRIRISQIHCGSLSKADQGCTQYFTGVSGRIRSFNFDAPYGRQLSNQDYSICLRTEKNFCSVQYTPCPDPAAPDRSRSFTLSGNSNTGTRDDDDERERELVFRTNNLRSANINGTKKVLQTVLFIYFSLSSSSLLSTGCYRHASTM